MKLQSIANISEICALKGVGKAVLSPGSRCAPLTLAFVRNPKIQTYTISDERSAAFVAMGMAQHSHKPVVLVCTSGSAAYNYAPAIAEAYFRQVPLLVLTADRPPEWIDQWDGQTIRQTGIYGNHIKKSYQMPVSFGHPDEQWHAERIVSEAINCAVSGAPGPVHINIPLREPFYPEKDVPYGFSDKIKIIEEQPATPQLSEGDWQQLMEEGLSYDKILIVGGQSPKNPETDRALDRLLEKRKYVVVGDTIANLSGTYVIAHHDVFLGCNDPQRMEALRPELLITFGQSLISKNLKLFLRAHQPKAHWHIAPYGEVGDTFQSLTKIIRTSPGMFFSKMLHWREKEKFQLQREDNFSNIWQIENKRAGKFMQSFFQGQEFGEFEATHAVLRSLPSGSDLHLANSMTVRYANFFGQLLGDVQVYANRGTSGIDGSSSTAVGTALSSGRLTTLITGDMAFFYDRNAFWHNYPMPNLRVIILNNQGGGIFRLINGPSQQPELEEYFETRQMLRAENTAKDFGFAYTCATDRDSLEEGLKDFFEKSDQPKLLEIMTANKDNQVVFNHFKKLINNNYGEQIRMENH